MMNLEAAVRKLLERTETDEVLLEQFQHDPEGVLLRETGMSADELQELSAEMGDDELAAVAGGSFGERCRRCGTKWLNVKHMIEHIRECGRR